MNLFHNNRACGFVALATLLWLAPLPCSALILTGTGNQPVHDPGWPEGALAVANLDSRTGWWEGPPLGGGEWHFLYRGNTEAFQEALTAFAAMRAPALDLVIHDGPTEDSVMKTPVDWTFTVWVPASWHRLYNNPKTLFHANDPRFRQPLEAPRLEVYVGRGQVDWAKVKVPANVRVKDERASAAGVDLSGGSVVEADFYDMDTGKPVPGVRLLVETAKWQAEPKPHWEHKQIAETASDAAGHARVDKVPSGGIRVTANAENYAPRHLSQRNLARPELLKFTVELAKAASIRGAVTDTDGRPIQGAKVRTAAEIASNGLGYDDGRHYDSPDTWSAVTDAAGCFELKGLPTGYAQLHASTEGYHFKDMLTIYDVPATNVVLRLAGAGSVHVVVTDKQGSPLSEYEGHEVLVEIEPKGGSKVGLWSGSAKVKADGSFDFDNVPPGEYRLTSHPNPYSTSRKYVPEQIITVTPGARTTAKLVYQEE